MSVEQKEEKIDYLEVDDAIPGQNYVCLSFVSPEALIESKEAFKVAKFLQSVCKDKDMDFKIEYSAVISHLSIDVLLILIIPPIFLNILKTFSLPLS